MRQLLKLRVATRAVTLSIILLLGTLGGVLVAPVAAQGTQAARTPVSGPQAKPPVEPGSRDAKLTERLGPTSSNTTAVSAQAGTVAGVNFSTFSNYCSRNLVYTTVKNTTAVAKSIQVRLYNTSGYRDIFTSVAANGTAYPAFYGVNGAYTAYLYVWNGSTYQYDESKTGTNTCKVTVTRTSNAAGWVQLKIQNTGTAYATQKSTELAPYPVAGTYTGVHYDYPVAGGAAIYRWFQVGTSPYGIVSDTIGSFNEPYIFTGDL